jgi:hypothetical protein
MSEDGVFGVNVLYQQYELSVPVRNPRTVFIKMNSLTYY